MAVGQQIAIVPGALDINPGSHDGGYGVVHMIVGIPHVHAGAGEVMVHATLMSIYADADGALPLTVWDDSFHPACGWYGVVQP